MEGSEKSKFFLYDKIFLVTWFLNEFSNAVVSEFRENMGIYYLSVVIFLKWRILKIFKSSWQFRIFPWYLYLSIYISNSRWHFVNGLSAEAHVNFLGTMKFCQEQRAILNILAVVNVEWETFVSYLTRIKQRDLLKDWSVRWPDDSCCCCCC